MILNLITLKIKFVPTKRKFILYEIKDDWTEIYLWFLMKNKIDKLKPYTHVYNFQSHRFSSMDDVPEYLEKKFWNKNKNTLKKLPIS